jgi:predicted GNAT family N-acyltransferase
MTSEISVLRIERKNPFITEVFNIRRKVFIEEQNVREEGEYDDDEINAVYFLAFIDGKALGTARYRKTEKGIKIERVAVLKEFRGKGIGSAIFETMLPELKKSGYKIYLHSQLTSCFLYEKYGFVKEGGTFYEEEIAHVLMQLTK